MPKQTITTYFAPAERADKKQVQDMSQFVNHDPLLKAIIESIDG